MKISGYVYKYSFLIIIIGLLIIPVLNIRFNYIKNKEIPIKNEISAIDDTTIIEFESFDNETTEDYFNSKDLEVIYNNVSILLNTNNMMFNYSRNHNDGRVLIEARSYDKSIDKAIAKHIEEVIRNYFNDFGYDVKLIFMIENINNPEVVLYCS